MGYLDFLEQKIISVPVKMCLTLPKWLTSNFIRKNRHPSKIFQIQQQPIDALNRRHCGQSQQSAVIKHRDRLIESKSLGAERKKHVKMKKKKIKSAAEIFSFKRKK